MKFMMLMIPAVYQGKVAADFTPDPAEMKKMGKFNDDLGKAMKVLDINGLTPLAEGARVTFRDGKTAVSDGTAVNAPGILGGYWIVETDSKEELVKWAQRCPAQDGDTIEIRQIAEFD